MEKQCNVCKETKPLSDFRRDSRLKDGRQGRCKFCVSEKIKSDYPSKYKEKRKVRGRVQREHNRKMLDEYLSDKSCEHCGNDNQVVFEFHHTDPTNKELVIGQSKCSGWNSIFKEIQKCIILCANCHRIEHWRLRQETMGK